MEEQDTAKPKVFRREITLGNLISVFCMIGTVASVWVSMNTRLVVLETRAVFWETQFTANITAIKLLQDNQAELVKSNARLTALVEFRKP